MKFFFPQYSFICVVMDFFSTTKSKKYEIKGSPHTHIYKYGIIFNEKIRLYRTGILQQKVKFRFYSAYYYFLRYSI